MIIHIKPLTRLFFFGIKDNPNSVNIVTQTVAQALPAPNPTGYHIGYFQSPQTVADMPYDSYNIAATILYLFDFPFVRSFCKDTLYSFKVCYSCLIFILLTT